jgi:8-oxo-dGTP diphosphatase
VGGRFVRTLIFAALIPAAILVLVPALVLNATGSEGEGGLLRLFGLIPIFVGTALLAWCWAGFIVEGQGTPAPYEPPRRLVTGRLYSWVRNPMYLAVTTILVGEAMFYGSLALLVWTVLAWTIMNLFVVGYEEPGLRARFGAAYESYADQVPRWVPRRPRAERPLPQLRLATLVYAVREGQVLLLRRVKDPNKGLWVAPGGKIEPGESPIDCAVREMREETGLLVERPVLRGVMTETSPRPDYQWLTFIFVARRFSGRVSPTPGLELRWVPIDEVARLPIPPADAVFLPRMMESDDAPFNAKFEYDKQLKLLRWRED